MTDTPYVVITEVTVMAATVTGRYLVQCTGNTLVGYRYQGVVSVPCGYREWLDVVERRVNVGYGRYDNVPDRTAFPLKCRCGAWITSPVRLNVSTPWDLVETPKTKHTCENTCQWSESSKCRCACGGKRHGEALRDQWL